MTRPPWIVVTNYPAHPSPYFGALERANNGESPLRFRFAPNLPTADEPRAIVNLHRLKRLYRASGDRAGVSGERFIEDLRKLKARGFRLAWTLHNLYPIDGPTSDDDRLVTESVFKLSDAVLCHTSADASYASARVSPSAALFVTGAPGAFPERDSEVTSDLASLVGEVEAEECGMVLVGNIAAYREAPRMGRVFIDATRRAKLFIVGECRDETVRAALERLSQRSAGRVRLHLRRVPPTTAHALMGRAAAAVCHYASTGSYAFFKDVLYPSSVSVAVSLGTAVVAPRLPSVAEIVGSSRAFLYEESDWSIAAAFQAAEENSSHTVARPAADPRALLIPWQDACRIYYRAYETLCGSFAAA